MKTTLPFFLLVFLVSCSHPKPAPVFSETTPTATVVKESAAAVPESVAMAKADEAEAGPSTPAIAAPEVTNEPPPVALPKPAAPAAPNAAASPALKTTSPVTGSPVAPSEQMLAAGMIDFRNAPLDQVLTVYSELVNRTLLRPATLPNPQVTLTTRTALSKTEAVQALDAVLGMNGITMINVGDKFVKVVTQAEAPMAGSKADDRKAEELPEFGPFVTHVVQLKYAKVSEVMPAIQPFAKMNSIVPLESTGILVIRDYTENVKRMLEMIEKVDIAIPAEFISEVIPIKYAKASEIADALNSLSGGGGGTSIGRSATGGSRPAVGSMGGGLMGGNRGFGAGGYGGASQMGGVGGVNSMGGAGASSGNSFTDRLRNIVSRAASASGDLEILGKTKMIADERSNSLLIFATRQDLDMIKSVISKLDVVLSQVLIETVIMDVQMGNSLAYGVSAGQNVKSNGTGMVGGVYNNSGNTTPLSTLSQFFTGSGSNLSGAFPSSSGLSYFGRYKGDMDVVVQAAATDSRINVIQKPRILTSHATPGSIFVGNTVPYVTGTYYGGGYNGASSSYQQLQVGIGLQVTPYINPEGLVVMQIDETIDEIGDSVKIDGNDVPKTTSRKLSAEVAVNDGDSVLLGGFIRNSTSKSASGVPLLKDIPILGALFSSKSDTKARSELLVMMRPTVLKTPEIAAMATKQEKKRLPGVSAAEAEVQDLEKKELEREQKRINAREKAAAKEKSRSGSK